MVLKEVNNMSIEEFTPDNIKEIEELTNNAFDGILIRVGRNKLKICHDVCYKALKILKADVNLLLSFFVARNACNVNYNLVKQAIKHLKAEHRKTPVSDSLEFTSCLRIMEYIHQFLLALKTPNQDKYKADVLSNFESDFFLNKCQL